MPEVTGHAITILVYDRGMPVPVNLQTVHPRKLAAVRREVAPGAVGSAWGPALGKVWEFIRSQPGLRTDGHNIFLYHHPTQPGAPILAGAFLCGRRGVVRGIGARAAQGEPCRGGTVQ